MTLISRRKCQFNTSAVLSIAAAALLSTAAFADVNEVIEKNYDFSDNGRIQLSNINGDVKINACDCSQVSLRAEITASSQEVRERISINIEQSLDRINIKTKYKNKHNGWFRDAHSHKNERSEVTYTLDVPNGVSLDSIDLVNGDLDIKGVTGRLDADLVNGSLNTDGLTASTRVDMVNGNMTIRFDDLSNAKDIQLESVNGDIEVYLPSSADATIDAETVSGRISNEFGIEVIKHRYVGSEMQGTLGNGDTRIKLENVNGRIAVKSN